MTLHRSSEDAHEKTTLHVDSRLHYLWAFFLAGIGGMGDDLMEYVIRIGGAVMLMAGLGLMLELIVRQQKTIDRLTERERAS